MGDGAKTRTRIVRVTVDLPGPVWDALVQMADEDGVTKTEMLRRSISVLHFVRSLTTEDSTLMVQTADGELERVVFPW
jgi:hypothetical protein